MLDLYYAGLNFVLQGGAIPAFVLVFVLALQLTQRA